MNTRYYFEGRHLEPPLTYTKLQGVMFFLPVSYLGASTLINSKIIIPIKVSPRTALIGITVFDFIDSPVGPYRELALTIPVATRNYPFGPNFITLLFPKKLNQYFALYTIMLAMNTAHGRDHASQLFGYPVYDNILDIDFRFSDQNIKVRVEDGGIKVLDFEESINTHFKKNNQFYHTIFSSEAGVTSVDLSATTLESSKYMNKLTSFNLGEHYISNKITHLKPAMLSVQTSYYKNAVETLSIPHKLNI